jgi:cobalt-precorrin-6B (C15)-methyltransferase
MWKFKTVGIPDEYFDRTEDVPITKEEIRAVQISKARLSSGNLVYDIGCGSGSITVEAALQVGPQGKIYAIDIDQKAVELTKKNLVKFELTNVEVIQSDAKQKIPSLPIADAIFIGGTGGDTKDIIKLCHEKLKSGARIVIGIILIETLCSVLDIVYKLDFSDVDVTQITISKSKKTSTGTMMLARNPVTIISATKN